MPGDAARPNKLFLAMKFNLNENIGPNRPEPILWR
jgi:hypothetical protein